MIIHRTAPVYVPGRCAPCLDARPCRRVVAGHSNRRVLSAVSAAVPAPSGDDMLILMISMRMVLAIAALSVASTAWGQQNCESLASAKLPSVTVTSAVSVAAGPFTVPGGRGNNTIQAPAFCRVAATIEKEVRIELWMPKTWNRKLVAV